MPDSHRGRLISFRISEEEYADLQRLCGLHGNNISETARLGLLSLLDHQALESATEKTIRDLEVRTRAMFFEVRELINRKRSEHGETLAGSNGTHHKSSSNGLSNPD